MLVSLQASPPLPARLVAGSASTLYVFIHHGWLKIVTCVLVSVWMEKSAVPCTTALESQK